MSLTVRRVGASSGDVVLDIIREAFGTRPPLDPPADALTDTPDAIATRLALGGGLLARWDGEPVGAVLLDGVGDTLWLRRFGVRSAARGRGVAGALVQAASEAAVGRNRLKVVAREELPATIAFWTRRGFVQTDRRSPYVELARPVPTVHQVPTAAAMRALGRQVAGELRRGDVLVLTGDLGAGKTTFTQGLADGLGVQGAVTSPTFVIAREHAPGRGSGGSGGGSGAARPGLVHVDAYRLGGAAELDDLDLDSSLDDVVTVVEWGEGLAEGLAESRLMVRITASTSVLESPDAAPPGLDGDGPRTVELLRLGPRWART